MLHQEACKLGSSLMKLKEERDGLKSAYELLQEKHEKLEKQHAADNGKCSSWYVDFNLVLYLSLTSSDLQRLLKKLLMPR